MAKKDTPHVPSWSTMVHRYTIQVAEGHQSNWFALPHRVVLLPMTVVHAPECVGRVYEFPLNNSVCNDSFFQYLHSLQKASVSTKQNQPSVSTTNINQPCSFSASSLVLFQTFSRNNHLLENSQGGGGQTSFDSRRFPGFQGPTRLVATRRAPISYCYKWSYGTLINDLKINGSLGFFHLLNGLR